MDAVCRRFAFLLEIDQLLWRIRMVYVSTRSFSLSLGWIRKDLSPNIHPKSQMSTKCQKHGSPVRVQHKICRSAKGTRNISIAELDCFMYI